MVSESRLFLLSQAFLTQGRSSFSETSTTGCVPVVLSDSFTLDNAHWMSGPHHATETHTGDGGSSALTDTGTDAETFSAQGTKGTAGDDYTFQTGESSVDSMEVLSVLPGSYTVSAFRYASSSQLTSGEVSPDAYSYTISNTYFTEEGSTDTIIGEDSGGVHTDTWSYDSAAGGTFRAHVTGPPADFETDEDTGWGSTSYGAPPEVDLGAMGEYGTGADSGTGTATRLGLYPRGARNEIRGRGPAPGQHEGGDPVQLEPTTSLPKH
jgi:hypothetical protein